MKVLLLDCETAPNIVFSWGLWNQNIAINQIVDAGYVMCWAAKWLGEDKMEFASIFRNSKKNMLTRIHKMLDEADVVIGYNHSKFDLPTLNKEFIKVGIGPPSPYKEIDLLRVARRQFKFASNKLDYVCRFLGLGGKTHHKGMDLWRECMAKNPESWALMEEYNRQDVQLLERLYEVLLPWIPNPPNINVYTGTKTSCARCGSTDTQRRGTVVAKSLLYQRIYCKSCHGWSKENRALPRDKEVIYVPA